MWFAEWLNKWLDIVSRILKDNRKCFSFMAQNLLHILSSWLLLPQYTFKNINQEECFPHVFPPPSFFCFETATALFYFCSIGNALSLGQGREKIRLEKQPCLLLEEGWEVRLALPPLHLELRSPPPSQSPEIVGPSPRWGIPGVGWAATAAWPWPPLRSRDLKPYLKPHSEGSLNCKSNSLNMYCMLTRQVLGRYKDKWDMALPPKSWMELRGGDTCQQPRRLSNRINLAL